MLTFDEDRASDSPYVERIWRSHSEAAGGFVSIAESRSEIVFAHHGGKDTVTVRGPETTATRLEYPADTQWLGIRFKPAVNLALQPITTLVDGATTLHPATPGRFWLDGSTWQVPDFDTVDTFVERLGRAGLLQLDPVVSEALYEGLSSSRSAGSRRTLQRRFVRATGVTAMLGRQIEQARYATLLLAGGIPTVSVAERAGYFDQPHLTRSLRRFIGQTPAQVADERRRERLSFLYKTEPFARA